MLVVNIYMYVSNEEESSVDIMLYIYILFLAFNILQYLKKGVDFFGHMVVHFRFHNL